MNALLLSLLLVPLADPGKTPPEGVLPVGSTGKPLNLDFETGTLADWTAEGEAFRDQPIKGDTVFPRRKDMKSAHQGQFWIGGFERHGDKPTGTLTSVPFTVTHPWASFLIGGGPHEETCVELVTYPRNGVFFRAMGLEEENMRREVVDLSRYLGKEIQIRIVDRHTGHWGHVNFDDFRLHSEKPNFPPRPQRQPPPKADEYKFSGLTPEKAAEAMTVPEGFEVSLFAGEPDVHQPVGFCLDDRGRLWVAEAYVYPKRLPFPGPLLPEAQRKKGDRILIFEDSNGDGKFDKKTTFIEGLNLVSGIEVGFGGVWVGAAPYLLFIPHDAATDKAGEPRILLDGWGYQDTHETLNAFIWGPDGWLYGCHGVFTHSRVGKPGTPDQDRIPINAGVWRYHPIRHQFEVFAHGTSNPWGLDYNDRGEFFVEACVIPHCFHIIHGARYQRQAGQHFNPYTYADIQTIADHRHYVGATPHSGNNVSDSLGGGHAHCGLMCYLGGTWPMEYRGQLFMGNIHGRRLNVDIPVAKGSGYVAKHGRDFLLANDAWARFINFRYGPDGNVYLIDWYDKQACHRNEPEIWDRTNGRVYKVSYKGAKSVTGVDLKKCSDAELVQYQLHDNDWYVRHARKILQEHAGDLQKDSKRAAQVRQSLVSLLNNQADDHKRLRALWALHAARLTDHQQLLAILNQDRSEWLRGWALQLLGEGLFSVPDDAKTVSETVQAISSGLTARASKGQTMTPYEYRQLASFALRVPADSRLSLLEFALPNAGESWRDDHNLTLLYWYALEPIAETNPAKMLELARASRLPALLSFAARRVGALGTAEALTLLVKQLQTAQTADQQLAYLRGLSEGLKGRRNAAIPQAWPDTFRQVMQSRDGEVRAQALAVGVALRDPGATQTLLEMVSDSRAEPLVRQNALASLLDVGHERLGTVLKALVKEPSMRTAAIRGMARVADAGVPQVLIAEYPGMNVSEKRDVVNTLSSRVNYGSVLLDAIAARKIPAADVPAETIRQLRNLGNANLSNRIAAVWGTVRDTPADRKRLIAEWTRKVSVKGSTPDLSHGRAMFVKVCAQCHTLYGEGGKVGPDITGSNRADLGYLLENMFDPSAVIPKEYAATKLELADGRVITGIIKEENPNTLLVLTANESLTIPVKDVEKRTASELSMMPDDLTKQLTENEIRDLIAYLRYNQQVPLKASPR